MADIQTYLDQIKNAQYGKDVRQSIHDGIKQCYDDGKAGAIDLKAREDIASLNSALSRIIVTDITNVTFKYNNENNINRFEIAYELQDGCIALLWWDGVNIAYDFYDGTKWNRIWTK